MKPVGLAEAQSSLENTKINVKAAVASDVATLISAQEQLALQRSNATLVQQVRDLVEKEYAAGQASLVRLNEAQRDLVAAHGNLALSTGFHASGVGESQSGYWRNTLFN